MDDYRIVAESSEWMYAASMYIPITIPVVTGRVAVRGRMERIAEFVLN